MLSCTIGAFPCKYLGIPLSTCKLRRSEEQFLIDIVVARIPLWKGHLMNTTGKVALTQATLSAIPVHLSIVVCLSPWAVMCRVAWEVVCRPRSSVVSASSTCEGSV